MARKEENLRSCSICKHLESFESDEVCWLLCTKKEIDFTFHGEDMEKTAKECDSYEED
jgi:hypothetical protein